MINGRERRNCVNVMDDDVIERVEKGSVKVSKPRRNMKCFV